MKNLLQDNAHTSGTVINGQQLVADDNSAHGALVRFYAAFNGRDMQAMQGNWLNTGAASMSNPLGGVKRGWDEISSVYQAIFNGQARVYVEFYDYLIYETASMFCAVGRERGHLQLDHKTLELAIRTSRIYCRQQGEWKQLHHHGSMDDARLLANYQAILLNK